MNDSNVRATVRADAAMRKTTDAVSLDEVLQDGGERGDKRRDEENGSNEDVR